VDGAVDNPVDTVDNFGFLEVKFPSVAADAFQAVSLARSFPAEYSIGMSLPVDNWR
jgi:hypothetical protein